jgi:hypothetical protein
MKKFGTPIGAAPGSAIDVVGLAIVGSPASPGSRERGASGAGGLVGVVVAPEDSVRVRSVDRRFSVPVVRWALLSPASGSAAASSPSACSSSWPWPRSPGACAGGARAGRGEARPARATGRGHPARARGRRGRRRLGGRRVWATGAGRRLLDVDDVGCRDLGEDDVLGRERRVDVDRHDEHAPVGQRDLEGAHLRAGGRTRCRALRWPARRGRARRRFWDA